MTVTDEMVERAWAAIVGRDIASQCFNVSIVRGDLRTALEAVSGVAQRAPNHGNALTDVGPDFRVVSVRVLQSAYDRIDAMLASIEPDLRAANSVRIELRHLINERHTGAAVTSTDGCSK